MSVTAVRLTRAQRREAAIDHAKRTAADIRAGKGSVESKSFRQSEFVEARKGFESTDLIGGLTVGDILTSKEERLTIHRNPRGVVVPKRFTDGNYVQERIFFHSDGLKCRIVRKQGDIYVPMGVEFDIVPSRSGHPTVVFRNALLTDGMYASCTPLSAACYIRDVVRKLKRDDSLEAVLYSTFSL